VLFSGARIIILDEPTSAISPPRGCIACSRSCAPSVPAGAASSSSRTSSTTCWAIADHSGRSSANGRRIVTEDAAIIDKGWVIERMIGSGHRDLEESYTGAIALDSKPAAPVYLAVRGHLGRAGLRRHYARCQGGRGLLGVYGFMGCGQIELARALFGKLKSTAGTMTSERQGPAPAQHGRCAPRRCRLRSRKPPFDAVLPGGRSTRTCRSACWAASRGFG